MNKTKKHYLYLFVYGCILLVAPWCTQAQILSNDTLNRVDAKGLKQGYWKKNDSTKNLSYEGYFINDMPHGRFVYRNKAGEIQLESIFFREGYANYIRAFYPKTGILMSEGYYLDKQKDSVWRFYGEAGQLLKEEFYKQNLLNGTSYLFDENKQVVETQEWFRGLRNGKWWQKTKKGIQMTSYQLNKSQGLYNAFYPDSSLYIRGMYNDGLKEGDWLFYLADGHLYKKDSYKENQLLNREVYVSIQGKPQAVCIDTIAVITIANKVSTLYSSHEKVLQVDQPFSDLAMIFDTDYFFYANAYTFVSIRMVKSVQVLKDGSAKLILKCRLPLKIQLTEDALKNIQSIMDTSEVK